MLALRIIVGLGLAYTLLMLLAWLFQDRLAFPAPRASLPDPKRVGVEHGEQVELVSGDGTKLVGWYLAPKTNLPQLARLALVLRQRRDHRRDLADRARVPAAGHRRAGPRLPGLRRQRRQG